MFCPVCGSKIYKGAKYCKNCGLKFLPDDAPPPPLTAVHIPEEVEEAKKQELPAYNKRIKPVTSLTNIMTIFYFVLVLLIFFKLQPRTGNVLVTLAQCIVYSSPVLLLAVLYNSIKGRAEFVRSLSFVVTAAFIMVSILGEMGRYGVAGGRLAGFGSLEESWMGVNCRLVNCNSNQGTRESEIDLEVSGEFHLATPMPMKKVYLVDPSIASISIVSPTEARVTGKSKGSTSLSVWDISGKEARFKVKVM